MWLLPALLFQVFTLHVNQAEFVYNQGVVPSHCGRNAYDEEWYNLFTQQSENPENLISKRIVGGVLSRNGEWPWLASLMFYQTASDVNESSKKNRLTSEEEDVFVPPTIVRTHPDGSRTFHLCGGTLIHPQWVLTAAHCFTPNEQYKGLSNDPSRWIIRLGEHDMLDESVPHFDIIPEQIIVHEKYKNYAGYGDIALIKLQKPAPLGRRVNIACLPDLGEKLRPGYECSTIGWGHEIYDASNISAQLRHVEVPIVSNKECSSMYAASYYLRHKPIFETMLCAGHPEGGRDACQFDSGGPLVCKINDQWRVMGVVSFGEGCGLKQFPGVYTNVAEFIPWIQKVTNMFSA